MGLTPGQDKPDGVYQVGSVTENQSFTDSSIKAILKGAPLGSFTNAQSVHNTNVIQPVDNAQSTATTVQSSLPSIKYGTPLWNGLDPSAEVTMPYSSVASGFTINQANARGGFVRLQGGDEKRVFTWLGSGNSSITNAYIDIYKLNTSNGTLTLVHQSPNISSSLIASTAWHQYSMDVGTTGYLATKGDVLYIELRVIGGGSHTIQGKTLQAGTPLSGVYPQKMGGVRNGGASTTSPSSITTANYTATDDVPFFELATDHGQDDIPRSWSDIFARGDGGLGSNWISRSTTSNQLEIVSQAVRYNGTTDGAQAGLWLYPLTTDAQYAEFTLNDMGGGTAQSCLFICSDNLMTNLCALKVNASTVKISTGSYSSMTDRASVSVSNTGTDKFAIQYDPGTNTFSAYKNGNASAIVTWTDATNIVSHGDGHQFVGIVMNRTPFNSSGTIGVWKSYDVI